jgi:hypothetical protein
MSTRTGDKPDTSSAPLYRDLYEFIDVMGIKQQRVFEAFGISRSYWFKLKRQHMNGLSLENMHGFATYFNLPPEKVLTLCYMTYIRGIAQQQANETGAAAQLTADPVETNVDTDFPPIG